MKKINIIAICLIIISISISIYKINMNPNLKTIYIEKIKTDSSQKYIMLLLTIPIAMLIITIFRIIVGINTFGNFTPILLSFVFQEMHFIWTISFFFFIFLLIYFLKNLLNKIKLLFISRLSILFTFIIIFISILFSTGYFTILEKIFPLILIITIIISEQFCTTQIENKINLLFLFLQTIFIGYLIYLTIFSKTVQFIMFFFPENLLSIIGILILIGKYTGLRLTELWKFQSLKNV